MGGASLRFFSVGSTYFRPSGQIVLFDPVAPGVEEILIHRCLGDFGLQVLRVGGRAPDPVTQTERPSGLGEDQSARGIVP
jgi:hypothetical protein